MDHPLKEKTPGKPCLPDRQARILVAPLDWGLGHATRCIPIIRELLAQGCEVWLAGEGAQEHLLKTEFPQLPFLNLPGYRIYYAKTKKGLLWKMIQQGPKMRRAILYEHQWLKRVIKENRFDAVISDNRYGLYHSDITCIFITHQLNIKSSAGRWTEKILQNRNYKYINRFTECWVPDLPASPSQKIQRSKAGQAGADGENNLAGQLSHPEKKPTVTLRYIGFLSRFQTPDKPSTENKDHLVIILSGPEPQRSILEDKAIREISHYNGTAVVVRGLPGSASLIPSTNMIHFYNHLPADELKNEMLKAEYIISRCGYSTVMDIAALQKKSILIPTPGQTEQEYLSKYLLQKQIAFCISQKEFSLNDSLVKAKQFAYHFPEINTVQILQQVIFHFIASLAKK